MIGVPLENRRGCRHFPGAANGLQAAWRNHVRGRSGPIVRHGGGVSESDDDLLLACLSVRRQIYEAVFELLQEAGGRDAERRASAAADYAIAFARTGSVASAAQEAGLRPRTARRLAALVQHAGARRGLAA